MKVHERLGSGLLESVYEEILSYEFDRLEIPYRRQSAIPVTYDDIKLNLGFRADLIVDNRVIVEIKSIESVAPVHSKAVLTYMRLTGIEVGLLINFNVALLKSGITRLVLDRK